MLTRPELKGSFGMVASTHWLASQSGMAVLERGGNAFDAAVAAGLVLQVVEPHLNGPGGEVPILGHDARTGESFVVCGQGTSPRAMTIEHFRSLGLELIPGDGLLPATVPGAFGAWMLLLQRHGRCDLRDVMTYAIETARSGFPVVRAIEETLEDSRQTFEQHWPTSAALYLDVGRPISGSMVNPQLASTYEKILDQAEAASRDRDDQIEAARRVFYEGFVAEEIARFVQRTVAMDASGRAHRGLLAYEDMAAWSATIEEPLGRDYEGLKVLKTPPWGQGPVFLQQLALLEGFDLAALNTDPAAFIHTVVECSKLAFADREAYYGDPDHADVPMDTLLDETYIAQRRRQVDNEADPELRPGSPQGRRGFIPSPASGAVFGAGVGEPTVRLGDTCHVDAVDAEGNLVSATPSGGWLQSSPIVPELGFPLGTRAQMFWLVDGHPNAAAPRKRPRTTLSPTLALRDGEPYIAFGTPGGDAQDQWSLVFFLRHVHGRQGLQESIDAPMWHSSHFPSSFYPREAYARRVHIEDRFDPTVIEELRRRGHEVILEDPWSLGRLSAVATFDGFLHAAANPRGEQGYAVGR